MEVVFVNVFMYICIWFERTNTISKKGNEGNSIIITVTISFIKRYLELNSKELY